MSYLDTSVLAAYYCPERLSSKVQKILADCAAPAISPLVELELVSAVSQKVRLRELSSTDGSRILSLFKVHLTDGLYRMVAIGPREYALANQWVSGFSVPLRTLDALHLAAAFANDLTMLTADRALAKSGKRVGASCDLIR